MFPIGTKIKLNTNTMIITAQYRCKQCKKTMNPVDAMVNPVCLSCTHKNHKKVTH